MKAAILGLPNVGKSTLFNALAAAQVPAENRPFCTIDPNLARVPIPDPRLDAVARASGMQQKTYATLELMDVAGLVQGASRGEGLGNRFLAQVREADAAVHVLRCFESARVTHVAGAIDPVRDAGIVNTELALADLAAVERALDRARRRAKSGGAELRRRVAQLQAWRDQLDSWERGPPVPATQSAPSGILQRPSRGRERGPPVPATQSAPSGILQRPSRGGERGPPVLDTQSAPSGILQRPSRGRERGPSVPPTQSAPSGILQRPSRGGAERGPPVPATQSAPAGLPPLLTAMPTLFALNVAEQHLASGGPAEPAEAFAAAYGAGAVRVSAQLESELAAMPAEEQAGLRGGLGLPQGALERFMQALRTLLGLNCFFTAGPSEARAWLLPQGATAWHAAGRVHSDFQRRFARAEVTPWRAFTGTPQAAPALKGRDYIVSDGDVLRFRAGGNSSVKRIGCGLVFV